MSFRALISIESATDQDSANVWQLSECLEILACRKLQLLCTACRLSPNLKALLLHECRCYKWLLGSNLDSFPGSLLHTHAKKHEGGKARSAGRAW